MQMTQPNPNLILIVMDTTRARALSAYGCDDPTTPHLDALAEESVLYDHAVSPSPWTLPAHASLFTGQFPSTHRTDGDSPYLATDAPTLAEKLSGVGYECFGVSNNVWISDAFGMDRGFERLIKTWQYFQRKQDFARTIAHAAPTGHMTLARYRRALQILLEANPFVALVNGVYAKVGASLRRDDGAARSGAIISRWLERRDSNRPYFLFINYMEPHARYDPRGRFRTMHAPEGVDGQRLDRVSALSRESARFHKGQLGISDEDFALMRALYHGALSYLDVRIGELLERVRACGDWENTAVFVVGDHGENIGDHGLMAHRFSLHETLVHVPLIAKYPRGTCSPGRATRTVQLHDLYPTLLELAGLNPVESDHEAHSLFDKGARRFPVVSEYRSVSYTPEARDLHYDFKNSRYNRTLTAVYEGAHKLIVASDGHDALYDLSIDPDEFRNLATSDPGRVERLRSLLESWLQRRSRGPNATLDVEIDALTEERLRALGYL